MALKNKTYLGQHWLKDRDVLDSIAAAAELNQGEVVLEIGPGLGTLTSSLLKTGASVVSVEFDKDLASKLPGQFPGKDLKVVNQDILQFDLNQLPKDYKVVANVPYYITSKIVNMLMTAKNRPSITVLLVQKEVAERIAAEPGDMSLLALGSQIYAEAELADFVPRELFTPPPRVDSQVVILYARPEPLIEEKDEKEFFRIARAGFSAKRKKLRSSLAGGLQLDKKQVEDILVKSNISLDARAEDLSIEDWKKILDIYRDL